VENGKNKRKVQTKQTFLSCFQRAKKGKRREKERKHEIYEEDIVSKREREERNRTSASNAVYGDVVKEFMQLKAAKTKQK